MEGEWFEHPVLAGYFANREGEVWSAKKGRKLDGCVAKCGYLYHSFNKRSKAAHIFIYECVNNVAVNSRAGYEIDHIDANIRNNRADNLQMLTRKDHKIKTSAGKPWTGFAKNSKPVVRFNLDENGRRENEKEFLNSYEAVRDMGLNELYAKVINLYVKTGQYIYGYYWEFSTTSEKFTDIEGEYWAALWKEPHRGFEVSNKGRIKTRRGVKTFGNRNLKGYCQMILGDRMCQVHRLVCLAFHGNPPTTLHTTVNHIDEVKHNNAIENLEWATHQEQIDHSHANPVYAYKPDGTLIGWYKSCAEASRILNVNETNIQKYLKGRYKGRYYRGYEFKHAEKRRPEKS